MGNGSKITSTIVAAFLGVFSTVVIAFGSYVVNTLDNKIDAQGILIEKMDGNLTELTKAINAGMTSKVLIEDDIADLKEEFDEHVAEDGH